MHPGIAIYSQSINYRCIASFGICTDGDISLALSNARKKQIETFAQQGKIQPLDRQD